MNNTDASIDGYSVQQAVPNSPRVLIIEDDEDSRYLIKLLLEINGYQTVEAENSEQVLSLTQELHPDLIILNIGLPVEGGLSMLRRIHSHSFFRDVPIIVTSSYAAPSFQAEAMKAGSNAFFLKPIDFDELSVEIKGCLASQDTAH